MAEGNRLNIWKDRSSFLGCFPAADWHSHGSPVLLVGISGSFEIEFRGGQRFSCGSAFVDSDVSHRVWAGDELMALFYINPRSTDALRIRTHYLIGDDFAIDVVRLNVSDRRFSSYVSTFDFRFDELLIDSLPREFTPVDSRIEKSLRWLHQSDRSLPLKTVAEKIDLSCSRYSRLFSESMGVSFRKYRQWSQLSQFYSCYRSVGNLTDAALLSGYTDSSHLSNAFKNIFGVSPSKILRNDTELTVNY